MLNYLRRIFLRQEQNHHVLVHYEVHLDGQLTGKGHFDVSYQSIDWEEALKACVVFQAELRDVDASCLTIVWVRPL